MFDNIFGIHGDALQLRARRLDLIASNIANAATPGYKARDIDFAAALARAEGGGNVDAPLLYRIPQQASLDGNTVELGAEQTRFAENALQFETTLSILGGRISTLMSALRGE